MFELLVFLGLVGVIVISLLVLIILVIAKLISKNEEEKRKLDNKIKLFFIVFISAVILNIILSFFSQIMANTEEINGENSISKLEKIKINGTNQWISIRGENKDNPIILFLAGGPGGTQMAAVRHELGELEKKYVVVNWDQAGSGKSYGALSNKKIDVNTYIEDGIELTKYLIKRFNKEKIYLIGESWGSALGIFLINENPTLYHSFIGTGQMIDFKKTEIYDYNLALSLAKENGDEKIVEQLLENGEPPYYGKKVTFKSAVYLNYLSKQMSRNPNITNSGYNTIRDIASSEYGVLDKINFFRGIIFTFNNVYQKLYDIDLRKDYKELQVPVYFILGRHDLNAPISFVEQYYSILEAPKKEIIYFENSGHSPWINERNKFIEKVNEIFK